MTTTTQCQCKFVAAASPMDNTDCTIHTQATYRCDSDWPTDPSCDCIYYRPRRAMSRKTNGDWNWPRCVCGHIAQAHN